MKRPATTPVPEGNREGKPGPRVESMLVATKRSGAGPGKEGGSAAPSQPGKLAAQPVGAANDATSAEMKRPATDAEEQRSGEKVAAATAAAERKRQREEDSVLDGVSGAEEQGSAKREALQLRYPCTRCDESFTRRDSLQRHVHSIHEGERQFCPVCGQGFSPRMDLRVHVRRHHVSELSQVFPNEEVVEHKGVIGGVVGDLGGAMALLGDVARVGDGRVKEDRRGTHQDGVESNPPSTCICACTCAETFAKHGDSAQAADFICKHCSLHILPGEKKHGPELEAISRPGGVSAGRVEVRRAASAEGGSMCSRCGFASNARLGIS